MIEDIVDLKNKTKILQNTLKSADDKLNLAKGQMQALTNQLKEELSGKEQAQSDVALYQKTGLLFSEILNTKQATIERTFGNIGSLALSKIFGSEKRLIFKFDPNKKKNPAVDIKVVQPFGADELETDIVDAEGGAMVDLVALTLRLSMLELYSPRQTGPLFLDEIFRYIAKNDCVLAVGEFLREIVTETDRQIILITHTHELLQYADKTFEATMGPRKTIDIKESVRDAETED